MGYRALFTAVALATIPQASPMAQVKSSSTVSEVVLPQPRSAGELSLEETLASRRSVRDFTRQSLRLDQVGQLLWAAQGVTSPDGGRTAPSAGALYPLAVYVLVYRVEGLTGGIYWYGPSRHVLKPWVGDPPRLGPAAVGQRWIDQAPIVLVIAARVATTRGKYGGRAERYVQMESGHVAQNVYLQSAALGLGTTMVGAFDDSSIKEALELPEDQTPLAILPVGYPRGH